MRRIGRRGTLILSVNAALVAVPAYAALSIFGGPTYSSTTNTGATPITLATPGHSAAEGVAAGAAVTSDPNATSVTPTLGYRWDAAGLVERLGNDSVGNFFVTTGSRTVTAIAANRAVVGYSHRDSGGFSIPGGGSGVDYTATYWDASNAAHPLAVLSNTTSNGAGSAYAMNLNRTNVIVGSSESNLVIFNTTISNGIRAVRWDSYTAAPVELTSPTSSAPANNTSYFISQASLINDLGNVAGTFNQFGATKNDNLGTRPVRWAPGSTTPTPLATFPVAGNGGSSAVVNGQNASGTIVGACERTTSIIGAMTRVMSAVRWDIGGTALTELGDLSVNPSYRYVSQAYAINDSGVAVGYTHLGAGATGTGDRPLRWNANSAAAIALPTLGISSSGAANGRAYAINRLGTTAGYSERYSAQGVLQGKDAVLWLDDAQTTIDLNTLLPANSGWHLDYANDITTAGFVTGTGTYDPPGADTAYQRGFMMLVPQAGTYGRGDANFDGTVNFDDLVTLAQNYGKPNAAQSVNVGDFNLDGMVNFDDLVPLAQNYNRSLGNGSIVADASFAADWALAQSLVPEPTTMLSAITVFLVPAARRRQR